MIHRAVLAAVAALAVLNAADLPATARPAPPTATGALPPFSHAVGPDAFGYYLPRRPVRIGRYQFDHLHLGDAREFLAWERGRRRATYAPVMLVFSDLRSPMTTNELGQSNHAVQIRVMPRAYRVAPGDIRFRGRDRRLGEVRLDGRFDPAALARAMAGDAGAVVVVGGLQVGQTPFRDVSLTWFGGD